MDLGLLSLESAETRADGSSLVQENVPQVKLPEAHQYSPFPPSTVTSEPLAGRFFSLGQPFPGDPVSLNSPSLNTPQRIVTSSESPFRSPLGRPSVFSPGQASFGHSVSLNGPSIMPQRIVTSSESPFRSPLGRPSAFSPGQASFGHPVSLDNQGAAYKGSPFKPSPLGQPLPLDNAPLLEVGKPVFGQPSPLGQPLSLGNPSPLGIGQLPSSSKTAFGLPTTNNHPSFEKPSSFRDLSWLTKPIFKPASSFARSPFTRPPDSHEPSSH